MVDLSNVSHHPAIEEITDVICKKTQNVDRGFYRVIVAYYLAMMASSMRATMSTPDMGDIPVNSYTIALGPSGSNKGRSVGMLENLFTRSFRKTFLEHTLPVLAETNIWKIAIQRAAQKGTEDQLEVDLLVKEYESTGEYPFSFDGGSSAAIKQIRQKSLIAGCGSLNLFIDEIGLNLEGSIEALTTYLELYDQGFVRNKITKNSHENKRTKEIEGKTPANLLMFGTPTKLLDGASTEDKFYTMLDTGYARRCLFALGELQPAWEGLTATEIFNELVDVSTQNMEIKWETHFETLADPSKFKWNIEVTDDVAIALIQYRIDCEALANKMPEHEEIRRNEMRHRYFKALKLAGALAFSDEAIVMDMSQLLPAIKLVEESGLAFQKILAREKSYMKLARYIAAVDTEVTHSDLFEALPFYKSGQTARNEMLSMATAWGYKQHIVIKKRFENNIEFFLGETLKQTSLEEIVVSYSDHFAQGYEPERVSFSEMHNLTQAEDMHWCNHHFKHNHRLGENIIPTFNMIVIDVDGTASLKMVHELLEEFVFMTYTTKRHTPDSNRFRLIIPMNYELKLDEDEYRQFMNNFMQWLPFDTDDTSNQRAKKWMTNHKGSYHYSQGTKMLDILPFVPKTTKNEEYQKENADLKSLDNLERWFAQRIGDGNRNNQFIKFALALVDAGMDYAEVEEKVLSFNKKLSNKLSDEELRKTVLVTVARKLQASP